jgi:hypothetical protein
MVPRLMRDRGLCVNAPAVNVVGGLDGPLCRVFVFECDKSKATRLPSCLVLHHNTIEHAAELLEMSSERFCVISYISKQK